MKRLLLTFLMVLGLSACTVPYTAMDYYPNRLEICFVDMYSRYHSCDWYSYDAFRYYHGFLNYRFYDGRFYFYHYNWYNSSGEHLLPPQRFKENPRVPGGQKGKVINGKGYSRSGVSMPRTAVPRNPAPKPSVIRRAPTTKAPPVTRTIKPKAAKRRGGGG
jgi:hypothetical protein